MALLLVEANKLSNNDLVAGVIEEIIDRDELFALLPFVKTNGKAYVYNRENTLATVDFLDPNDPINESASTFTEVTTNLRIIAGDVDVDKFLDATMSDTTSQRAVQIAQKAKAMGRKFRNAVVNGDNGTNLKEFDGIKQLAIDITVADATRTISAGAAGGNLTFTLLDELSDMIPNGPTAFMMRSGTLRYFRSLLRAMGGNTAEMVMIENFGQPVPAINGVPVIVNDYLPANETLTTGINLTSIYAMRLNEVDGLHALFGGDSAGFVIEDIGTVQNKDATRTRVKWYCGLALKSTQSLARLQGVANI